MEYGIEDFDELFLVGEQPSFFTTFSFRLEFSAIKFLPIWPTEEMVLTGKLLSLMGQTFYQKVFDHQGCTFWCLSF